MCVNGGGAGRGGGDMMLTSDLQCGDEMLTSDLKRGDVMLASDLKWGGGGVENYIFSYSSI